MHFIKKIGYYNFLSWCLFYALTAIGLEYLLSLSFFSFSKPGIKLEAQENRKIGNNKIKKTLNILNKRYFIKKFDYYNFLS